MGRRRKRKKGRFSHPPRAIEEENTANNKDNEKPEFEGQRLRAWASPTAAQRGRRRRKKQNKTKNCIKGGNFDTVAEEQRAWKETHINYYKQQGIMQVPALEWLRTMTKTGGKRRGKKRNVCEGQLLKDDISGQGAVFRCKGQVLTTYEYIHITNRSST
jgi:hypothetical protein